MKYRTPASAPVGIKHKRAARGESPIAGVPEQIQPALMKHNKVSPAQNQNQSDASQSARGEKPSQSKTDFIPSPDAVARKAYFAYVNEGSFPGHEVQHWLAAEAELIEERRLTRVHGFHNRT